MYSYTFTRGFSGFLAPMARCDVQKAHARIHTILTFQKSERNLQANTSSPVCLNAGRVRTSFAKYTPLEYEDVKGVAGCALCESRALDDAESRRMVNKHAGRFT